MYSSSFGIKHKPKHGLNGWGYIHQIQQVCLCPSFSTIRAVAFMWIQRGVTVLTKFPRTSWPRRRFSESQVTRISVKISRICVFRVIMEIMTGLLGCCSSSTLGSWANDYAKNFTPLGFWCIIHPAPSGAGRTTPSQPGCTVNVREW